MKPHFIAAALAMVFASAQTVSARDDEHHEHHHHATPAAAAAAAPAAEPSQQVDHSMHQMPAAQPPGSVKVKFGDAILTDQNGRKVKLKSELIRDQIVVMDFAYTTCTTVCPVLTALMVKVQNALAESGPAGVQLITISVDPARDTSSKLRAYAEKHGAKPGWRWLTGPTGRVNEVLKGFGAYAPSFEDHPPLVLVGDPVSGNWTRFVGFTDPQELLAKVRELHAARGAGQPAGHQH